MPRQETYLSSDGKLRFTVTPGPIEGSLSGFEGEAGANAPRVQAGNEAHAEGRLEQLDATGHWTRRWERALVNKVAPVQALVDDSGRYVVTFDNWHAVGFGNDVVVIYGADGRLIRSLALSDIVSSEHERLLPRSVSSIWWRGKHRIDGERLVLQVVKPDDKPFDDQTSYVEVPIDLATGERVGG
jgi:hypothetical protein